MARMWWTNLALTPAERARHAARLREFEGEALPEIQRRIESLQGTGDDDAYDDAVDALAFVSGAIETLRQALEHAGSLDEAAGAQADDVRLGSQVDVAYEDGTERTFTIGLDLYDCERETGLSYASPVAQALVGRRAGDVVSVGAPAGQHRLRVLLVSQGAAA